MIKKRTGFTLIEMIIVLSITVLVMGIVMGILMNGHRIFNQSDVKTTLQEQGQAIQEIISNICMEGSEIESVDLDIDNNKIKSLKIKSYYKNGNTAEENGNTAEENGNIAEENGNTAEENGNTAEENDNIAEENGNTAEENGNTAKIYNIELNNSTIAINGKPYQGKVKSIQIDKDIVKEAQKITDSHNYNKFSSIAFNIVLTDKKGFSGQVDYPINFTVAFRNKGR